MCCTWFAGILGISPLLKAISRTCRGMSRPSTNTPLSGIIQAGSLRRYGWYQFITVRRHAPTFPHDFAKSHGESAIAGNIVESVVKGHLNTARQA